jgi:hypothetical protein
MKEALGEGRKAEMLTRLRLASSFVRLWRDKSARQEAEMGKALRMKPDRKGRCFVQWRLD